jgi:hypothetical protein
VGLLPVSVVSAPHNRLRLAVVKSDPVVEFPHRDVLTITRVGFQTGVGKALLNRLTEVFNRSAG